MRFCRAFKLYIPRLCKAFARLRQLLKVLTLSLITDICDLFEVSTIKLIHILSVFLHNCIIKFTSTCLKCMLRKSIKCKLFVNFNLMWQLTCERPSIQGDRIIGIAPSQYQMHRFKPHGGHLRTPKAYGRSI